MGSLQENLEKKFIYSIVFCFGALLGILIILGLLAYNYNRDLRIDSDITISQSCEVLETTTEDPSDPAISITKKEFGREYLDVSYNSRGKSEQVNDKINIWFQKNPDRYVYNIEILRSSARRQIIRLYLDPAKQH